MGLAKSAMEKMASQLREDLELDWKQPLDPFKLKIEGVRLIPVSEVKDFSETVTFLTDTASSNWSAMSVPMDGTQEKWAVVYNDVHDPERQRVSVMEEVWHILQGHKLTKIVKLGTHHSRTFEAEEEHDAYYLASASLVPQEAVESFIEKKMNILNFAASYGVSKDLVEYRIKRLGFWYRYKQRSVELIG